MRNLASILFAAALAVVMTPPVYLPGQVIIRPPSGGGGAPVFLVDEDFEGTGIPSGWTESGTVTWDKAAPDDFGGVGKIAELDASENAYVSFAGQSEVWAAGKFRADVGAISGSEYTYVNLRGGSTTGIAWKIGASPNNIVVAGNGANLTTSSTFTVTTSELYYWLLRYTALGTCEIYFSIASAFTSSGFPSIATDTSTQFSYSFTDTNNLSITNLRFTTNLYSNGHQFDDIYVSTSAMTDPWGEGP